MNAEYSLHKSLGIFSFFLFFFLLDALLTYIHIPLMGFLGLPPWFFFLPLCIWEFVFWGIFWVRQKDLVGSYITLLLTIEFIFGLFYWLGLLIWAFCIEGLLIWQIKNLGKKFSDSPRC